MRDSIKFSLIVELSMHRMLGSFAGLTRNFEVDIACLPPSAKGHLNVQRALTSLARSSLQHGKNDSPGIGRECFFV